MGLRRIVRVGKQIQTKLTNISLAVILSVSGLAGSAPLFLTQKAHAATPEIQISEVDYNGSEWVELHNTTSMDQALNGWKLTDLTTPSTSPATNDMMIFTSETIPAGGYIAFDVSGLNDTGDSVGLYKDGIQVDRATYLSVAGGNYPTTPGMDTPLASNQSYSLINTNWTKIDFSTKSWENNSYYVSPSGSDSANGNATTPFATLQMGLTQLLPNGTLHVMAGTHNITSTLNFNQTGVKVVGDGQEETTINAAGVIGYGVLWTADNVSISNLTLEGSTSGTYGLKIQADPTQGTPFSTPITGVSLSDVTVRGFNVNEVDLHFVNGAILTNVTADGNGTGGVGIAATDSTNIQIFNAVTTDNAWGGVAMYSGGCCVSPGGSSNIVINGLDANELNPFYVEEEGSGVFDFVSLSAPQFSHTVTNEAFRPDAPEFTFFQESELEAVAYGVGLNQVLGFENDTSVVREWQSGNLIVGEDMSIQTAVDAASANDTIQVLSGTYAETVTVNKILNLLGAQSGVDARTRSTATETVMNASGGAFNVTANDVVIDGFTIQGAVGSPLGTGISLGSSTSGVQVRNNIIQDNIFGLYLNGHDQTVEQNVFRNNNQPGSASGDAIYSDQGLHNSTVENNYFTGHASAAMVFSSPSGTSGLTINNNNLVNDNSIVLLNTTASSITNNVSLNSNGSTIFIGGGVNGLAITGNTLQDGLFRGIRVAPDFFGFPDPNQNITVHSNKIVGNIGAGIDVTSGRYVGTLDATSNWWGSNLGPSSSQVVGNVDTSTWCADDTCTPPFLSAVGGTTTLPVDEPVDLSGLVMVSGGNASAEIPGTNEVVISATSGVEATIQGGTTVTASDTTWDGTITPPVVSTVPAGSVIPGTVGTVIEIGSSTVGLTFDQPVRLLIPGQAGKRVGFIPAGSSVFTEITTPCLVDSGAILAAPGINECKIDVGSNLVIWTNHFTKFVTYAPAVTSSGGGSSTTSGNSSSTSGRAFTPPFIAAAASGGVLGSSSAGPQTSSTVTEKRPAVAQATPVRSNAGELLGLMWYWWLVILMLAGTALYGIYRMADTTERR